MSFGESSEKHSSEQYSAEYLVIQELCDTEVLRGLTDILQKIIDGSYKMSDGERTAVEEVGYAVVLDAVEAGDQARAEAAFDRLLQIPDLSEYVFAKAGYAVVTTGSQRAYQLLSEKLETEQLEVTEEIAKKKEATPLILKPHIWTAALDSVIYACEKNNTPPDSWIDTYAINEEHKWKLHVLHHYRMAKDDMPEPETHQRELDYMVGELAADESVDPAFLYDETGLLLALVKDEAIRIELLERYRQVTANIQLNTHTFSQLLRVGYSVLKDRVLATQGNIEFFEATINTCADLLRQAGADPPSLTRDQLSWRMTLKQYYGASPSELVEYLDLQVSEMLAADLPEDSQGLAISEVLRTQEFILRLRDTILQGYTERNAEAGDFTGAEVFISNIGSGVSQTFAINGCLKHVSTQDQIDAIKPDDMTLMLNPELEVQLKVAEAKEKRDNTTLNILGLELVSTAVDDEAFIERRCLELIFTSFEDEKEKLDFARKVLAAMREAGAERTYTAYYSKALIQAGDPDEPQKAYEEILANSSNPAYRLRDISRLAHV